jgi:hypothetical protein
MNREVDALLDGRRLVFLGGLHRSGTSLVHRCFSDHGDISGFADTGVPEDEGQHLQDVYPPAAAYGGSGRFGHNPASYLDESSPLVSEGNARRLLSCWLRYWDTSKRFLVEKSPPNIVRTRFLQALFPECRQILVLRHPVAVAYATQKWTPGVLVGSLIENWLLCHERFDRDRPHLAHAYQLRYEDFVREPQRHMDEMLKLMGLPPSPLKREVKAEINDRYFAVWTRRRRNPLTRPYFNRVIDRYEDRLRKFGYSFSDIPG